MSFFYTPTFTYYKIAKIQNLPKQGLNSFKITEKTPPKHRIAGKPSGVTLTSGGAWTSRTTVTGGVWIHLPLPMKTSNLVDQDRLLLLFPSVPAVHLLVTCTRSKNTQTQQMAVDFNLFFSLQICSRVCFWSALLQIGLLVRQLLLCPMYWRRGVLEEEGLEVRSSGERGAVVDSPYMARRKEIWSGRGCARALAEWELREKWRSSSTGKRKKKMGLRWIF